MAESKIQREKRERELVHFYKQAWAYPINTFSEFFNRPENKTRIKEWVKSLSGNDLKKYLTESRLLSEDRVPTWIDIPNGLFFEFISYLSTQFQDEEKYLREVLDETLVSLASVVENDIKKRLLSKGFAEEEIEEKLLGVDSNISLSIEDLFSSTDKTPIATLNQKIEELKEEVEASLVLELQKP